MVVAAAAPLAIAPKIQWAGLANDVSVFGSTYTSSQQDFNLFCIAIAWQHAQTEPGKVLNETNMHTLTSSSTQLPGDGGKAIIDIHNYARWYCAITGQPGNSFQNPNITVTNAHFTELWVKLATRYGYNPNVISS
ncbi:Glycoside hydrolase, subgroup, catalytic core [Cordyceps fumosorosea ARSEF 2679]|uniref:cellulase n=1 Tax=Cordyceps fumosorosea (strain ARSEF 2679) TaxID=1081104 RepID=A0A167LE36_CORFA|nr:Glycoside hydrolase, subgroup, catalytic core [Cordyceps fumosorosea ARSEF 2679]OAA52977.1 Glycoside hydrolase, subgroup, catalytic core [Cordyceps fumosorosea ARSEF 2679]